MEFVYDLIGGKFDFSALGQFISSQYEAIMGCDTVKLIWDTVASCIGAVVPFIPYFFMALALVEVFFGTKLLSLQKFFFFLAVGFGLGVYYVAPLLDQFILLPHWVMGLVVGIVAAVLFKLEYVILYILAAAYSAYILVFANFGNNMVISAAAALVAVVLALIFRRKFVEFAGTAFLGAFWLLKALSPAFDVQAALGPVVYWAVIAVVTALGFFVQFKMRKRY